MPDVEVLARADVIITDPVCADQLRALIEPGFTEDSFQSLRPNHFLAVFIRTELWDAFIESRSAPTERVP